MARPRRLGGDKLHERKEEIAQQVRELVDLLTNDLHPEDDEEIRQELTEQFRFWRN